MESLLFDLIITGFILLTIALAFGFLTVDSFFAQHLAHKTVFSIISWFIYGSLLIGHYKLGWRDKSDSFYLNWFCIISDRFYWQ